MELKHRHRLVSPWADPAPDVHVTATHLIRKMSGGSQSILLLCDDDNLYVVKMVGNPQGPNVLANEMLGGQLAKVIGLTVPVTAFISISNFLIDNAPKEWFENYLGNIRPRSGLHCGSRLAGSPSSNSHRFDLIGRSQFRTVANRSDFLGMFVLDVWANHQDARQAVFHRNSLADPLLATLIDHGSMFGGPHCIFDNAKCDALYFDTSIYKELWSKTLVAQWNALIQERAPWVLEKSYDAVPPDWYNSNHQAVRSILLDRLGDLDALIAKYSEILKL